MYRIKFFSRFPIDIYICFYHRLPRIKTWSLEICQTARRTMRLPFVADHPLVSSTNEVRKIHPYGIFKRSSTGRYDAPVRPCRIAWERIRNDDPLPSFPARPNEEHPSIVRITRTKCFCLLLIPPGVLSSSCPFPLTKCSSRQIDPIYLSRHDNIYHDDISSFLVR